LGLALMAPILIWSVGYLIKYASENPEEFATWILASLFILACILGVVGAFLFGMSLAQS